MRGFCLPKSSSRKKILKSCNMKGKFENVVFIDVDGDPQCEDVIIIDAPESVEEDLEPSGRSREGRRFPSPDVISIDDDDDDNTDDPEIQVDCGFDLDRDAFSNKSFPAPYFVQKSVCLDDYECRVIQEKQSACKLSKRKKTYIGKTPCGKRFGLRPESEDSSSESDYSDCEIIEGSVGKFREQWEKAFQKKKYNARCRQSGVEDQTSASGLQSNMPSTAEEENRTEQCTETPVFCDSNIQKQNTCASGTSNRYSGGTCPDPGMGSPCVESDKKVDHESWLKFGRSTEAWSSHVIFGTGTTMKDPSSRDKGQGFSHSPLNCDQHPSNLDGRKGSNQKEKLQPNEPLFSIPKLFEKKQDDNGVTVVKGSSSVETPLGKIPLVSGFDREKVLSGDNSQYVETQIKQSCLEAEEMLTDLVCDGKICGARDRLPVLGADTTASSEKDVIIDREKLKQTDQYKRAAEEEWASRHRELQSQAEEAQRLRKKKRAESMRLLDMERRQKQRLEEMRKTKKKDEEQLSLKEQLRLEVRKELNHLESSCSDMPSLLRSLGITVNGGFSPLSQEVHAAYRRALLRFHPDRLSKTDIRQQVEAEEKFKLISRMKEKYLVT